MVFSSIEFLCLFLPCVLILYKAVPSCVKNIVLLIASLAFYAWGEPKYIFIMLFSTVVDYTNGILIEKFHKKNNKKAATAVLVESIVVNIGILMFFKYTDFVINTINDISNGNISLLGLALPIGISFYTFQTLSYTIDVYRQKVQVQHNIINFGLYVSMFPQLIAGPIVRYADVQYQMKRRDENYEKFANGIMRFCAGLGKKVLLANQIGALWNEIGTYSGNMPALTAWLGAISFMMQIYFDFSGYSDMAIGLGMMFGFDFPENFKYPYESKSITEFWRRWHITLGVWFREYLYIPLGGNRKGTLRLVLNLLIVWFLTGLWHGAGWNFIIWGLYYFVILTIEKLFLRKYLEKVPTVLQHIYSILLILFGWVIFANDDISMLIPYIKSMLGFNGFCASMSLYYLSSYLLLFIIMIMFSTHLPKALWLFASKKILKKENASTVIKMIFSFLILFICLSFLIGDSYNPFLYFRF